MSGPNPEIPYDFAHADLLDLALTHSSIGLSRDNERLEFLGDAALDLVVAEELYRHHQELPEGPWDAIIANDVLHHITDLEGLYARIHEALAPRGRFVFNEYVGPNRFQYDDERMELINRYFRLFPDNCRWDPVSNSCLWKRTRVDA